MSEEETGAFEQVRDDYAKVLRERIDSGDTLTDEELAFLSSVDNASELPSSLHVKKPKPLRSEAQQKQAMANIERINRERLQTGPNTEEGKRIASRNAIKLGIHAQRVMNNLRPCLSTCPEYPCALVTEDATHPGSYCLEKHNFTASLDAIHKAIVDGDHKDFKDLMAVELAAGLEVISSLRDFILTSPVVLHLKKTKITDKNDNVIENEERELKANPALATYQKLLSDMGISFREVLITPKEIARNDIDDKSASAMAVLAGHAGRKLKSAIPDDEAKA